MNRYKNPECEVIFLDKKEKWESLYTIEYLRRYYGKELPKPMSDDEIKALIKLAQEGDLVARNTILEHNLRMIYEIAYKRSRDGFEIDDLFQVGCLACIKAIERFNLDAENKFSTFLGVVIVNDIRIYIRSNWLKLTVLSLDAPISMNEEGDEIYLSDVIASEDKMINEIEEMYERELIMEAIHVLSNKDQEIIRRYYGLGEFERHTFEAIAKIFNCSRANISNIHKRSMRDIKNYFLDKMK